MKKTILFLCSIYVLSCTMAQEKKEKGFTLLSKKDLRELINIVGNHTLTNEIQDSLCVLLYDQINKPTIFDSIHKNYYHTVAPNLNNPHPTLDNWKSYNGDSIIWQSVAIFEQFGDFRIVATIDGVGDVVTLIENSKIANTVKLPIMKSDIFEDNMTLLNTELMKSNRQLVSTDTFVFIINSKDLEKLKQL